MSRKAMRRNSIKLALGLLLLQLSAAVALADNCDNAISQTDMDVCAGQQFDAADKALNATYAKLMKSISPAGQTSLRSAQRAWLAYRDKQCAFNVLARADASVYPMVMAICRTALTNQQNNELKAQLNCEEGDLSCGGQ
jgi:uncharacterized protein YecT (DUF1311 family)